MCVREYSCMYVCVCAAKLKSSIRKSPFESATCPSLPRFETTHTYTYTPTFPTLPHLASHTPPITPRHSHYPPILHPHPKAPPAISRAGGRGGLERAWVAVGTSHTLSAAPSHPMLPRLVPFPYLHSAPPSFLFHAFSFLWLTISSSLHSIAFFRFNI